VAKKTTMVEDQKIAAFGSSYKGNAFQMQELPKAAIF
jgi:GTP-dependent phosphoenolpyruvate carboxykinase